MLPHLHFSQVISRFVWETSWKTPCTLTYHERVRQTNTLTAYMSAYRIVTMWKRSTKSNAKPLICVKLRRQKCRKFHGLSYKAYDIKISINWPILWDHMRLLKKTVLIYGVYQLWPQLLIFVYQKRTYSGVLKNDALHDFTWRFWNMINSVVQDASNELGILSQNRFTNE